jgi:cation/acetate symporter
VIYTANPLAIILFAVIVAAVLIISFYFGTKKTSAKGYFAAGGAIPWHVNGVAFAGDYLSAASFLGICGMIAFSGYDGFLYSIGYLAGWIVALFVVAEPLKRLGKFTFADALDSRFGSKGIRLMAGVSTLVVSIFYLIPQMVGAGALVVPLLGLPDWIQPHMVGVIGVGIIVILIVVTAGMKSTTYVQFIKGALLIVFSTVLVIAILLAGISERPDPDYVELKTIETAYLTEDSFEISVAGYSILQTKDIEATRKHDGYTLVELDYKGTARWFISKRKDGRVFLEEVLSIEKDSSDGMETYLYNGLPKEEEAFFQVGHVEEVILDGQRVASTGPLDPFTYLAVLEQSEIALFQEIKFDDAEGDEVRVWYKKIVSGSEVMRPGMKFLLDSSKGATAMDKLNFISLMIALFFGTAALPHVLIRYYTVPKPKDARKSTILAIVAIGFFYILTLYIGLGAMSNGVIDVESSNMAAPLLADKFNFILFAIVSAIAFATVLGTVSGLIVASAGAVAHDLAGNIMKEKPSDSLRVIIGKAAAVIVGIIAIGLGIAFKGMNVSFLVGWAFSIAASANFPSIIMMLFWKKTTAKGITASVGTGMISALTIILLSESMFDRYGIGKAYAPIQGLRESGHHIHSPGLHRLDSRFSHDAERQRKTRLR